MIRTRKSSLRLAATLAVAMTAAPLSAQANDTFELTLSIIDTLNNGSEGGKIGFGVKEVNGPTLLGHNTSGYQFGVFYPASTLKVLHHLTAMRWVALHGIGALGTPIPVYSNSCAGTGSVTYEPLDEVLQKMMVDSSNSRTNAIQDYFGQSNINHVAQNVVGMVFTELNHKFGGTCGGPNQNPPNKLTIDDIILLYERYVRGELLPASYMNAFESLMLNQNNSAFWDSFINNQANIVGLSSAQRDSFRAGLRFAHKGGSWGNEPRTHESRAGFVSLPNKTCKGLVPLRYAYGVFVDNAISMTSGITSSATRAMLRREFRDAMRTFKPQALFSCIQDIQNIMPKLGGGLIIQAGPGRVTLSIPPDYDFNRALRLEVAELDSVDNVPYGRFDTRHNFWFGLIDEGEEVSYPYVGEAEIVLTYSTKTMQGMDEYNLALYRWNEVSESWEAVTDVCPTAVPRLNTRTKELRVNLCESGHFALFAPPIPV